MILNNTHPRDTFSTTKHVIYRGVWTYRNLVATLELQVQFCAPLFRHVSNSSRETEENCVVPSLLGWFCQVLEGNVRQLRSKQIYVKLGKLLGTDITWNTFLQVLHEISPKDLGVYTFPHAVKCAFFPLTKIGTVFLYYSYLLQDRLCYKYFVENLNLKPFQLHFLDF